VAPVPFRDFDYDIDRDRVREIERQAQEMARDASRIDQEQVREITRRADEMAREAVRIDQDQIREIARIDAEAESEEEDTHAMPGRRYGQAPVAVPTPRIAPMPSIAPMAPMRRRSSTSRRTSPIGQSAPWIQGDRLRLSPRPRGLNSGDYGRASRLFGEVTQKYNGKSQLVDAQYFEALARYKIGTTTSSIRPRRSRRWSKLPVCASTSSNSSNNEGGSPWSAPSGQGCTDSAGLQGRLQRPGALYNRVNGALAQRGDAEAKSKWKAATRPEPPPATGKTSTSVGVAAP
jgi:hypothetical protein